MNTRKEVWYIHSITCSCCHPLLSLATTSSGFVSAVFGGKAVAGSGSGSGSGSGCPPPALSPPLGRSVLLLYSYLGRGNKGTLQNTTPTLPA